MTSLPPWRQLLRTARQREGRSPAARWLQLATVAVDGTPRVRTLVFRGWADGAELNLLTDGRSALPGRARGRHSTAVAVPAAAGRITLEQVELLELGDHPHYRRRWRR